MKILYCIAGTRHSGGMERVLANKANWLVRHGYEVAIVTTDQEGEKPFFPLDEHIKCYDLAIGYERNNGKSFINKLLHYPIKQYRHRKKLTALLKQLKPDITISMFCNDVAFLPKIKDGSKKILEIHFSKFKRLQYARTGLWRLADTYRNRQEERQVRRFDRFVVLTEEDKGYWGNLPNIEVIPNARTFNPTSTATLDTKRVVAIGRYTHQKGFDRLIKVWSLIHAPEWNLYIIGEGEDKSYLQSLIAEYHLENCIHLSGPTLNIEQEYLNSSLLIMTSRYEGFGLVLIEALSYGVPIIAFDCKCGPKDIIKDGINGFIIEDGNIKDMATKTESILHNHELRLKMGKNARTTSQAYAEETIMKRWTQLFDTLKK